MRGSRALHGCLGRKLPGEKDKTRGIVLKQNILIEVHASQVYTRTMFEKFGEALYECGRMISWKSGHTWSTLLGTSSFSQRKNGARMSL
uniref:Uncharacterized protein n=1 Tax=Aegilops tauschii subsp. strangulata TaxID=200361 RepID=A0A453MX55_AEGTS